MRAAVMEGSGGGGTGDPTVPGQGRTNVRNRFEETYVYPGDLPEVAASGAGLRLPQTTAMQANRIHKLAKATQRSPRRVVARPPGGERTRRVSIRTLSITQ